jgi:hypothetical protein
VGREVQREVLREAQLGDGGSGGVRVQLVEHAEPTPVVVAAIASGGGASELGPAVRWPCLSGTGVKTKLTGRAHLAVRGAAGPSCRRGRGRNRQGQ